MFKIATTTISLAALLMLGGLMVPIAAHAQTVEDQYQDIMDQGLIFANICSSASAPCDCRDEGRCTLEDILQVAVNLSVFILGISGSVALMIFIYGGFMWVTSQGNSERITSGKNAIIGAVVGLVIIFGSYAAITFALSVLKTGEPPGEGEDLEDVIGGGASSIIETANE
ncbi:MAG: hypothetical protein ABIA47_04085 [bacterium]